MSVKPLNEKIDTKPEHKSGMIFFCPSVWHFWWETVMVLPIAHCSYPEEDR